MDEASAVCESAPHEVILDRIKEINESFRKGISELESLSLQAADRVRDLTDCVKYYLFEVDVQLLHSLS
jgi:hypothetical protein